MELKEIKENSNYLFDIEADGNINEETIILCHSSGANIFCVWWICIWSQ